MNTTNTQGYKTFMAKKDESERNWWIVDAADQRVGRIATTIANLLRGKHKPTFTPHTDAGDFVIVINTDKVQMTGDKLNTKKYFRHSRFFGSLKEKTASEMHQEDSTFIVHEAVRGMLPTNKLSRDLMKKLKLFKGAEHTHATQKPQAYALKTKKKTKV